jgi:hypothetical protein
VRTIPPGRGLHYVSYFNEARVDGKPYVQLKSGEWVRRRQPDFRRIKVFCLAKRHPLPSAG